MNRIIIARNSNHRPFRAVLLVLVGLQLLLGLLAEPVQAAGPSFMKAQGDRLTINGQSITLKGSNFYPLVNSFPAMWNYWNADLVRQGLKQAAELGSNSVRILVPFAPTYGWSDHEDGSVPGERLAMLQQFLQIASEFNIRVIVSLFDFEEFPRPGTVEDRNHLRYARDIITLLRNDDRVLAWDLHNEPDNYPPWKSGGDIEPAMNWLYRMRGYIRSLDSNHLITIGAGKRESFFRKSKQGYTIADMSDFLSHHSYNADALAEEIYEFQQKTNRQKPIILEETGWPSGPIFSTNFKESIQTEKYRKTLAIAKSHRIAGVLQWMLYDAEPTGAPPWDDIGNYYGLIRKNGTLKPAALVWRDQYSGTKLPPATTVTKAPFTKNDPKTSNTIYFPETDRHLGTPMREMWRRAGSFEIFGFPVTDLFIEEDIGSGRHKFNEDQNKTPYYQYFEKVRFEYRHERRRTPEYQKLVNTTLEKYFYLIDLGNVGKELAAARGYNFEAATRLTQDEKTYQWFQNTRHSLQEPFLNYWRNHHGDKLMGAPISEPFEETNPETGQRVLVQYFEKLRLEYRPEYANTRSVVVVGNAGAELLKLKGWMSQANLDYQKPPTADSGEVRLDTATKTELNGSGGLAYRQLGDTDLYRYAPLAGDAATAGTLPGSVGGVGQPLAGPDIAYLAPENAGRLAIRLNDFKGNDRVLAYGWGAALSPDRQRLAYLRYGAIERTDLFIQDLSTGKSQLLASDVLPALSWSADGQKLAFYFREVNSGKLAVSENGGKPRVILTTGRDTLADRPIFSPDGKWLVYTVMGLSPNDRGPRITASEVRAVEIASGANKRLADKAASPAFSPDGSRLSYLGWNDPGLWLAEWNGKGTGTARKLGASLSCEMSCSNTGRPAFSPDGKWLAYTGTSRNLLAIRTSGGQAYALTPRNSKTTALNPVWVRG